jgi:predicted RNase H-like HicB family nuclease
MTHKDYKTVLCRRDDRFWVAEIPAISGCNALMDSRESALAKTAKVLALIAEEFRQKGQGLPSDSTEIINASRHYARFSVGPSSWIPSQPHDG